MTAAPPPICASVLEPTVEAALARMAVVAPWCSLVEVRLDALRAVPDDEALAALARGAPRPLLVTCRPRREGGAYPGDEAARLALLARAAARGAAWVDVEWDAAASLPTLPEGVKVLVSRHVLPGRAADLEPLLRSLREARADAQKLAVPVASAEEALRLLARCAGEPRPTACVAMGAAGVISRLAGTRWGAPWVYASADPARPAAPGSLGAEALARVLAGRAPGPQTALFGVTGKPVAHSRSPRVHGAAFAALDVDAVLGWLETGDPAALLAALEADPGARGLVVTIPHKATFARLLLGAGHALSAEARATGAVNTLVRRGPDRWSGHNTDALAARDLLADAFAALGRAPDQGRVAVVGTGGVARAVAWAAASLGAEARVHGRTAARARGLVDDLPRALEGPGRLVVGGALWDLPPAERGALDVIVNAASVGMGADARSAVPPDALGPGVAAYDLVYTPPDTPFLAHARARGARVVTGVAHFARQARAQVALWLEALGRDAAALDALPLEWFEARATEG